MELLYSLELERASIISSAVYGQVEYLFLQTIWDLLAIPSSAARSYSALAEEGLIDLPFPNKEIINISSAVLSDSDLASSSHTSCLPHEYRSMELTSWKRESGSGPRAADAALFCLKKYIVVEMVNRNWNHNKCMGSYSLQSLISTTPYC